MLICLSSLYTSIDFKREQVRVQVFDKERVLRVSGERPLDETLRITRRFLKEIILPHGCNINDITAKLIRGRLHVIMPIMAPNVDKLRLKSSPARFEKGRNVSMCFGITVAVMVVVGAFVAYNKMWV